MDVFSMILFLGSILNYSQMTATHAMDRMLERGGFRTCTLTMPEYEKRNLSTWTDPWGDGINLTSAEYTVDDCWALGLNKASLLCSSCDVLKKYDLGILKEHCLQCCLKDEDTYTVKRYAKAVLEVCTCKFGMYPQIQAFVRSDKPHQFPNLKIKYVRGLDPIIKLMDKDNNIQDILAIEKWDTDTVEEFLKSHLISSDEDEEDYLQTNRI